jgi:U3 small nucleolar RNA-associated protein 10
MTSLARQLERLAIPGQPSLRQLVSKKRPSLLFDRREAADMDADTFFSLGRNGLEELIGIDHTFSQFEDSLFTESSKEFERSVQTPDVLAELDRNLSVFLRRLSPYLLLKPAQKCLEWLVHAYRVHSCNVDAVVECVLPYYETKLFARVVQLLPLKSPSSRWHWLRPLQKAGSPLSRLSLVQHCLSDLSFLVFVSEMVPGAISVHKRSPPGSLRSVLALYCSTVITVLESEGGTDEEVVGRLLPYLLKGLKSRVVEYRAASYMIAGQLVSKASLEDRVSTALLDAITKSDLSSEALCCVAVICHTQNITKLSSKTVRNLLRVCGLPSLLFSISSSHDVSPLLKLLLSVLISAHFGNHGDEVALEMILTILDEVPLDEEVVLSLIRYVFVLYCWATAVFKLPIKCEN